MLDLWLQKTAAQELIMNTKILIWDLPTRLFHWLLAGSFFVAFGIGYFVDDDSPLFAIHMLLGATMGMMVLLRVVWGFVGSRYARFSSFGFGPMEILSYAKGIFSRDGKRYLGHNPGSSLAIWAMLALTLGLGLTGAFMSQVEIFEDVHEILAYALLGVVATHVAGVILHSLKYKENITMSMINGKKEGEPEVAIPSMHPIVAVLFLLITGLWSGSLFQNYDAATGTLNVPLLGTSLVIGEGAEGAEGGESGESDEDEHDDD